jgi:hypothetical protein
MLKNGQDSLLEQPDSKDRGLGIILVRISGIRMTYRFINFLPDRALF